MLRPDPVIISIIHVTKISHVVYHIYHFMDRDLILQITLKFISLLSILFYRSFNNHNTKHFVNTGECLSGIGKISVRHERRH
jgi:hypothetical protein